MTEPWKRKGNVLLILMGAVLSVFLFFAETCESVLGLFTTAVEQQVIKDAGQPDGNAQRRVELPPKHLPVGGDPTN